MTIREQAAAALAELRAREEREAAIRDAQHTKLVTQALSEIFDLAAIDYNFTISGLDVVIGDLSLRAITKYYKSRVVGFQLWGECFECGNKVWSRGFKDLAGLGKLLEEFKSVREHNCYAIAKIGPQSAADRVAEALQDLIAEAIEE